MDRRGFLRFGGSAAIAGVVAAHSPAAAAVFVATRKPAPPDLEPVSGGDVISAAWANAVVERLNALSVHYA